MNLKFSCNCPFIFKKTKMKNIRHLFLLLSFACCGVLYSQNVELTNLKDINSEELDFSPMPFGNGIMYTSSKSDRFLMKLHSNMQ